MLPKTAILVWPLPLALNDRSRNTRQVTSSVSLSRRKVTHLLNVAAEYSTADQSCMLLHVQDPTTRWGALLLFLERRP